MSVLVENGVRNGVAALTSWLASLKRQNKGWSKNRMAKQKAKAEPIAGAGMVGGRMHA